MLALTKILLLFIICGGISVLAGYDNATTSEGCYQALLDRTSLWGISSCVEPKNCAKCIVRVHEYHNKTVTDSDVREYDKDVERYLSRYREPCSLDLYSVIDDLLRELLRTVNGVLGLLGFGRRTTPTTETTTSTSGGGEDYTEPENECIRSVINVARLNTPRCSIVVEFTKCIILRRGLLRVSLSYREILYIELQVKQIFWKLGIVCLVDVRGIIDQLRKESTSPPSVTTTEETPYPWKPTTTKETPYPREPTTTTTTTTKETPYPREPTTTTTTKKTPYPWEPTTTTTKTPYPWEPTTTTTTTKTPYPWEPTTTTKETPHPWKPTTPPPRYSGCISKYDDTGCHGRINGDYPACYPECQVGSFISCSNGYLHVRECPLGFYLNRDGRSLLANLVYNPDTGTCERKSLDCPRGYDELARK